MNVSHKLAAGVVWLGAPPSFDPHTVGPKAAHLSRLASTCPVPPGFCVTAETYRAAARTGGMSPELQASIADAYARLGRENGSADPRVAVRSSAVDEDGPLTSFAGQHETLLNIVGAPALIEAIEQSWESARTEQALAYRRQHGLSVEDIGLAVLVQALILSDVSGVMFSANPVTGSRSEYIVSASWGLGESIVGGTVTPDNWLVDAHSLEVLEENLANKQRMTVAVDGGTREVAVPRIMREKSSLTVEQVREIAALGQRLEQEKGWPVDIEFAYSGSRLYLLQCRPITTLMMAAGPSSGPSGDSGRGLSGVDLSQ